MSQEAIKNRDFPARLRTVQFVIENRQSQPTHIRDLLLLAAAAAIDGQMRPDAIERAILADVPAVDVLAVAGRLVRGQVRALTVNVRAAEARRKAVAGMFETAVAASGVAGAVSAVSAIAGAIDDGEIVVAAVIARCLRAFDDAELFDAAIALIAAALAALAVAADAPVTEVVRWSVGDETSSRSTRSRARAFCDRQPSEVIARGRMQRR